jgi:hypothetical protein
VNVADLLMVRNSLGTTAASDGPEDADINGDGIVNIADLLTVRNQLGRAEAENPPPIVFRYKVGTGCTGLPNPTNEPVIEVQSRNLVVSHSIFYNCCPKFIRMCINVQEPSAIPEGQITFHEKGSEEAPCDCICYFPMKGIAGPFPPGLYHVEYYDTYGEKLLDKWLSIP